MSKDAKYAQIHFRAKIKPIKPVNAEFDLVKVYVMAPGKNRNMTYISKEMVESAVGSLYYAPVVGHIREYTDKDGNKHRYMGGHDWDITEDWEFVDITTPYGVVVDQTADWETVEEYGVDVEYLTCQAILWTGRYPELKEAIYSDDVWFNQSMEISIENYRPYDEDSNYMEILGMSFSALCLLGKADEDSTNGHVNKSVEHTEPAFISAKVVPYEFARDEFMREFAELKEKISFCLSQSDANATVDINETEEATPMDNENFEEVVDDVTEKADEVVSGDQADAAFEETIDTTEEEQGIEADPVDYEAMYNELKASYDEISKECLELRAYQKEHSFSNEEVENLRSYKENKEAEERAIAETELFSSFEKSIGETDEYASLKEHASEYDLEQLRKELYCVVGIYAAQKKTVEKPENKVMKFSLERSGDTNEKPDAYNGLKEKYLKK